MKNTFGNAVSLTPTEYEILKFLMENCGKVFSPREIYKAIWHEAPLTAENTVAVHIRHIREKIEITLESRILIRRLYNLKVKIFSVKARNNTDRIIKTYKRDYILPYLSGCRCGKSGHTGSRAET